MSKYTTQLRYICEWCAGLDESVGYNSIDDVINKSIDKIFSFELDLFDPDYKTVLCSKILRHYYTREICEETFGLWQLRLQTKLTEIIPYYNQLYKSTLLEFDPMLDVNYSTTHKGNNIRDDVENSKENIDGIEKTHNNGQTVKKADKESTNKNQFISNNESASDSLTWDLYSDTPQGGLEGIEDERYLTNAEKTTNESGANSTTNENTDGTTTQKDNSTSTKTNETDKTNALKKNYEKNNLVTTTDDYVTTVAGKRGGSTYSQMLLEFRSTFMNIDVEIIKELEDLFLLIW